MGGLLHLVQQGGAWAAASVRQKHNIKVKVTDRIVLSEIHLRTTGKVK